MSYQDVLENNKIEQDMDGNEVVGSIVERVNGVVVDRSRDNKLTDFGRSMMKSDYLLPNESFQDRFANVSVAYSDNPAHAQRIYNYMSNLWFMPATPVLSNGGTNRGMPISCFLNECEDSLTSIKSLWSENIILASQGGGIGSYWGNLRSIGEKIGRVGQTSGIMPFIKVQDSLTLAISQGSLRRGSSACYLDVDHPEIEEFIEMRRTTGGDPNRKTTNLHHGVVIPDAFMHAVEANADWDLKSPHTGAVIRTVKARDLWIRILTARMETGEPYMLFIDSVNKAIPEHHKKSNLLVKTSNLCIEITLPTGIDHLGKMRTAVCCLSSLNLEYFEQWSKEPLFIEDVMRFLDNVLTSFINTAPSEARKAEEEFVKPLLEEIRATVSEEDFIIIEKSVREGAKKHFSGLMDNAIYSASRERSIGLGVMGFHSFLQMKRIPFESVIAKTWNKKFFRHIQEQANAVSHKLALEKGPCPDAAEHGIMERFSNKTSIAPTASISVICGQSSAGIEPFITNAFNEKRKGGSFDVRNKHLKTILESYGKDNENVWSSIITSKGSVQHLDFLSDVEKSVFKTAFELDQSWIIEHAADRTPYIDQSQSVNLFLPADVHKKTLHGIHNLAWKKGLKSLYYCRSLAIHRAQNISEGAGLQKENIKKSPPKEIKYDECLACQ